MHVLRTGLVGLGALVVGLPVQQDDAAPQATNDPLALELLEATTSLLATARALEVQAEVTFDVVQDSGEKIEFGSSRTATVRRPDRAHLTFQRRDGTTGGLVLDGVHLWAYQDTERVFATAEQAGTVEQTLAFAAEELGVPAPLSDLLAADAGVRLTAKLESARVGLPATIGGVRCEHLALRFEHVDCQLWISTEGLALPRRVVITYREEEGQPQFRADLAGWNLAPELEDALFTFEHIQTYERIPFASQLEAESQAGEAR